MNIFNNAKGQWKIWTPVRAVSFAKKVENALKALHLLSIGIILAVYDHILYHFFQKGLTHLIWKLKESFLSIIYLKLHDMVSQCVEP